MPEPQEQPRLGNLQASACSSWGKGLLVRTGVWQPHLHG